MTAGNAATVAGAAGAETSDMYKILLRHTFSDYDQFQLLISDIMILIKSLNQTT